MSEAEERARREARRAQALRDNLKRRKAAAREREAPPPSEPGTDTKRPD